MCVTKRHYTKQITSKSCSGGGHWRFLAGSEESPPLKLNRDSKHVSQKNNLILIIKDFGDEYVIVPIFFFLFGACLKEH